MLRFRGRCSSSRHARGANEHLDLAIAEFRDMSPEATRLGEKMPA